jgi:site-specific recombinase XerD
MSERALQVRDARNEHESQGWRIAKTAGIKAKGISLHSMRHFIASQSITDGSDVRTVAALLGHSDPLTTLRIYRHLVTGAQE